MNKISPKLKITGAFVLVALLLVLAMPRTVKFKLDYKKGHEWRHETLVSQFDFPILKTEEQLQKEREALNAGVIPYYKFSEEELSSALDKLENMELGALSSIKPGISVALRKIFDKGVVTDEGIKQLNPSAPSEIVYIQKDKRASKRPVSEIYKLSDAKKAFRNELNGTFVNEHEDSVLSAAGIYDLLCPNLHFDQTSTDLARTDSDNTISRTAGYVSAGQLIVSKGEIVTAEIAQMLDSYRQEYDANIGYDGPKVLYWLGNTIIVIALLVLLFFTVFLTDSTILKDSRLFYLLLVFLVSSAAALLVGKLGDNYLYLVPFTVFALYLQSFFKTKVIIPVYGVCLMPLLIFTTFGIPMYVMFLLAGLVSVYCFQYLGKGWKQFLVALIAFAVSALVFFGFRLLGYASGNLVRIIVFLFFGSMLTVAGYPLVFLFEKLFNLVSTARLEELSNTGNPLIRKLELLAPGTFQHSLQVMHMSAAAARAVGGNVALIRAGALYHDIGKMQNPQCFVENESLIALASSSKYHQEMDPMQSAQDIIKHVSDGMELASRNNLPEVVSDFILAHHGTTLVSYFYDKFVKQGGDPSMIGAFRYNGHKPHSKEQIILMICDSVEAASRTLPSYDSDAFDNLVEKIVASKMEQGQFDLADITIREIGVVKSVIKTYLTQVYHERIVYPERKTK